MESYGSFEQETSGKISKRRQISIEEAIEDAGFGSRHVLSLVAVSFLVSSFYTKLEEVNVLGQKLLCIWNLTGYEEAILTSSFFSGAIFGAMLWGKFSDVYGKMFKYRLVVTNQQWSNCCFCAFFSFFRGDKNMFFFAKKRRFFLLFNCLCLTI